MLKKIKILSFLLACTLFANVSFAADFEFKDAPKSVEQTAEGIKISWEKIDGALGYLVMYSKNPGKDGVYDNELEDLVETTGALVPVTDKGTYYVAVSAFDSEYNEVVSPELTVEYTGSIETETSTISNLNSLSSNEEQKFTIEKVEIVSDKELKVTFSNEIDSSKISSFEFMLTPKDNKNSELKVQEILSGNNNQLLLNLSSSMDSSTEYELVVISVSDMNGNTIESGVDGMVVFSSPSEFSKVEESIELNSAPEEVSTGTTIEETNVIEVATDADSLPTTGPKEILVLILALMLGGVIFLAKRKLS